MLRRALQFARYTWGGDYLPGKATQFVIVGLSRSGSNLLAAMLDSHPGIICHHELFNTGEIHRSLRYKGTGLSFGSVSERDADPWAFAARVYGHTDGARAVGFKLLSRQNTPLLLSLLRDRGVRKIILRRRQWLEQFVSQRLAEHTNVWSSMPRDGTVPVPAGPPPRVHVDTPELLRFIRKREVFYRMVALATRHPQQPVLWTAYEDLGNPEAMTRLLEFLGVDPSADLQVRTRKQATTSLAERIENYAELQRNLHGTRHAWLVTQSESTSR